MAGGLDFAGMVPGFDFLQNLMKGAGAALPPMGQWVAPTLDPAELDKRIGELRTVQFWLEQNAKLLGATIQAMEVQRMTLATLQTMNLPMAELRDALTIKPQPSPPPASPFAMPFSRVPPVPPVPPEVPVPPAGTPSVPAAAVAPSAWFSAVPSDPEPEPAPEPGPDPAAATAGASASAAAIDPMQWWGALTQQFTEIASQALQAGAADTPQAPAPRASPAAAAPMAPQRARQPAKPAAPKPAARGRAKTASPPAKAPLAAKPRPTAKSRSAKAAAPAPRSRSR